MAVSLRRQGPSFLTGVSIGTNFKDTRLLPSQEHRAERLEASALPSSFTLPAQPARGAPMDVLEAPAITPEIVAEHGLSEDEYGRILKALGREPNLVELGIFSVMWSEHCSYKSSRIHLKKLPTEAPWVIQGPGENAGVIDIGDGDAAIFKMESHNHPSYIEPYQGAATGVGGILRDVFTMGARPVANMNALTSAVPITQRCGT